jgi:hypothetical protein
MAKRIQLSRKKGWKMPPNAVNVARPGLWGNPFWVSKYRDSATCIALFKESVRGCWSPPIVEHLQDAWTGYDEHVAWLKRWRDKANCIPIEMVYDLRGKDLACWCELDAPCHADVLLELANA